MKKIRRLSTTVLLIFLSLFMVTTTLAHEEITLSTVMPSLGRIIVVHEVAPPAIPASGPGSVAGCDETTPYIENTFGVAIDAFAGELIRINFSGELFGNIMYRIYESNGLPVRCGTGYMGSPFQAELQLLDINAYFTAPSTGNFTFFMGFFERLSTHGLNLAAAAGGGGAPPCTCGNPPPAGSGCTRCPGLSVAPMVQCVISPFGRTATAEIVQ